MNWAWAASLDQIWRSPTFPMWVTLTAAGFFAFVLLITLLRAEHSVANGALTVITLLAIGIAVAATIRGYGSVGHGMEREARAPAAGSAALPALACIDGLAGDVVLSACEKTLFSSAESAAAAVSYTAALVDRLTALGDATSADRNMTADVLAMRRTIERDRYGFVAQVLQARDHCTIYECAAFRSLTDREQVVANMKSHLYDSLVSRYSPSWNAPVPSANPLAMLPPSLPTGRPTNADFPSAASTPPVSIMTPEPGTGKPAARASAPAATASVPTQHPSSAATARRAQHHAPPPPPAAIGPTLLSPAPSAAND